MSLAVQPFKKWDVERVFYGDPILSTTERFVAIQLLKSLDDKWRTIRANLHSQALIGHRIHAWRSTVNRALRKLVLLGYFRAHWTTVQRDTKQGIKGVTRVMVELGPVLQKLVYPDVLPAQAHGVMSHHPSPTPPGGQGTASTEVVTQRTDRSGGAPLDSHAKSEIIGQWGRLAGQRQLSAERLPSSVPYSELAEHREGADLASYTELTDEQVAERMAASRARMAAQLAREQPRRKLPRSHR